MNEQQQSTFVTVIAWLAILGSGFAALMGLFQTVMLTFVMADMPIGTNTDPELDPVSRFMFGNFRAIIVGQTALWCVALVCAVGLLRRREWGRKGIVLLMWVAVAIIVGMAVWQQVMMTEMLARSGGSTDLVGAVRGFRIASGVMAGAVVAVMAWLAARLNSRDVKTEFS